MFKYIGIGVKQNPDNSITVNQNSFANTIQPITIPKERLTNKETKVDQEEKKLLRGVIGLLVLHCMSRHQLQCMRSKHKS